MSLLAFLAIKVGTMAILLPTLMFTMSFTSYFIHVHNSNNYRDYGYGYGYDYVQCTPTRVTEVMLQWCQGKVCV